MALAEKLLEKESINLPEIMKVLGERPYPLKESIREYLEELEQRKEVENAEAEVEAAEAATDAAAESVLEDPAAEKE